MKDPVWTGLQIYVFIESQFGLNQENLGHLQKGASVELDFLLFSHLGSQFGLNNKVQEISKKNQCGAMRDVF